ncbi:MAG: CHASE4 domain-containing protein, partial [Candidatus Bathyarchaeia archaeon]
MYGKAFDLHTMTEEPIPNSILEKINVNGTILNASNETNGVKGLILTSEDPMLIVSRPILTSYDEGPIQGTLIIGRYYDSTQITRL